MVKMEFLEVLAKFTEHAVRDMLLPVRYQREDETPPENRPAAVYKMRLPDGKAASKKAPYILHQIVTGLDQQSEGQEDTSSTAVRSIFVVYSDDEQLGGLMLLELMERVRVALLRKVLLDGRFQLDKKTGLETLIYPEDTAPYFAGEMSSTWLLPAVERELDTQWLM